MATTVYIPEDKRLEQLGGALGVYAALEMAKRRRQEQQVKIKQFMDAVQAAPSRAAAFEVVSNYSSQFRKPEDYSQAFQIVDRLKPLSAEEIHPVTMYNQETGEPSTIGMTRDRLARESDPQAMGTMFPGMSLTKPSLENFYMPGSVEGDIKFVGKLPIDKRPQGSMTLQEISQQNVMRREGRAEKEAAARDERFDRRMAQQDENQAMAERRLQATLGRIGQSLGERDARRADQTVKEATRLTAVMSNAKVLPDGSFGFDDRNMAELYRKQIDYITATVEANPKILNSPTAAQRLASEARRVVVGTERPADDTPVQAEKKGGLISRMFGRDNAGQSTSGKVTKGSETKGYKASNGKSYSSESVAAAAKKAGISVDEFVRRAGLTKE